MDFPGNELEVIMKDNAVILFRFDEDTQEEFDIASEI